MTSSVTAHLHYLPGKSHARLGYRESLPYCTEMAKPETYELIKAHKPRFKAYQNDRLLVNYGRTVLRLPPYHPDLNPTAMISALAKECVAQRKCDLQARGCKNVGTENRVNWIRKVVASVETCSRH